jgi:hypothetical protein
MLAALLGVGVTYETGVLVLPPAGWIAVVVVANLLFAAIARVNSQPDECPGCLPESDGA